jgi:hypothetical protein
LDRSFLEDTNVHERGTPQQLEAESDRWVLIVGREDSGGLDIGECVYEWLGKKANYISEYMNISEQDIWSRIREVYWLLAKQKVGPFTHSTVNCQSYCRLDENLSSTKCDALLLGGWFLAFWRIIVPSSSGVINPWRMKRDYSWRWRQCKLSKIRNRLPSGTVAHSRRLESSTTPLWEHQYNESDIVNKSFQVFTVVVVHLMSSSFLHHFRWMCFLHLQGE